MDENNPIPNDPVEPVPIVDLSGIQSNQEQIIAKLEAIEQHTGHSVVASDVITTYGVVFVPLIIITLMLWWFFRQFISQYR